VGCTISKKALTVEQLRGSTQRLGRGGKRRTPSFPTVFWGLAVREVREARSGIETTGFWVASSHTLGRKTGQFSSGEEENWIDGVGLTREGR